MWSGRVRAFRSPHEAQRNAGAAAPDYAALHPGYEGRREWQPPVVDVTGQPAMTQPVSLLTLQFLSWVADRPRTRTDVMEAWRSCPRTSAWEDCIADGLVRFENGDKTVSLTASGRAVLNGEEPGR